MHSSFCLLVLMLFCIQIARAQLGQMADGCGTQKSCVMLSECESVNNCTVGATFVMSGKELIIEIAGLVPSADQGKWIAFAFSDAGGTMDNGSIVWCSTATNNKVRAAHMSNYAPPEAFQVSSIDLTSSNTEVEDGVLYCKVKRRASPNNASMNKFFDLTAKNFTLILGYGNTDTGNLMGHIDTPRYTDEAIDFTTNRYSIIKLGADDSSSEEENDDYDPDDGDSSAETITSTLLVSVIATFVAFNL